MPWKLPEVEKCCGCVTDLRTAASIIAVLGIVTSPAVAWAVVRHSFVIRVSCFITSSATRADVVDINLNNVLSFGFGANAGLGPSCLSPKNNKTKMVTFRTEETEAGAESQYVNTVRWMGWIVLVADLMFLGFSVNFLYRLFRPPDKKAAIRFMQTCVIAIVLSFIYGMMYVGACISVGGAFPVFEFIFCIIDVMIWSMWIYFMIVIWSYIQKYYVKPPITDIPAAWQLQYLPFSPWDIWGILISYYEYVTSIIGYIYFE